MIPVLYSEEEKLFLNNGLGQMKDTMSSKVREVRNGEFELTVEYPVSGRLYSEIKDFRFIKAKPNSIEEDHVFRILDIDLDAVANQVTISASTITNDLGGNIVPNLTITDATGQEAMDSMKSAMVDSSRFDFRSDITTRSSTTWFMRNPLNCIAGEEGSLLDNWGGEIKRETNIIWLLKQRGVDNNVVIRHGKNLDGLDITYSTKGLITRILPYFTYTPEGTDEPITITGSVVSSQYVDNYPVRPIIPVDYSSDESVKDLATLNTKSSKYFADRTGVDKPSMTADVSLVDLSYSSEYAEFKVLEQVALCDTIKVYSKLHKVQLTAKVNELVYDSLGERNESVNIGSVQTKFFESIKKDYQELFEEKQEQLTNIIQTAANGKNRIFRGEDTPTTNMIKNDLWYKPVVDPVTRQSGTYLYIYDGTDWKLDKVSANMLNGTLDAENGDLNLINVNVQTIVGETSSFVRSNWNAINSRADIDGNRLRFTHSDGTSTEIGVNGLKRVTPADNRNYHYLFYATTFIFGESSNNARWIQLPSDYKGKQFQVYLAIADSMTAPSYQYSIQRFVCTVHPDHSIDYANARVPVISYKSSTLMDGNEPNIDQVQGLIFAIY